MGELGTGTFSFSAPWSHSPRINKKKLPVPILPLRNRKSHIEKLLDNFNVRMRMAGRSYRRKRSATGQCHRDQQLVGEVFFHRRVEIEVCLDLLNHVPRQVLSAHFTVSTALAGVFGLSIRTLCSLRPELLARTATYNRVTGVNGRQRPTVVWIMRIHCVTGVAETSRGTQQLSAGIKTRRLFRRHGAAGRGLQPLR